MPGRSAAEARNAFLEPLKRALSCITDAQLYATRGVSPDEIQALTLSEDPLRLRSRRYGDLRLKIAQQWKLVKDAPRKWHTSTVQYEYRLDDAQGELISWHWHPEVGVGFPHVHLSRGVVDRKAHIPGGRVSIEAVLRLLLTDFEVQPTRAHRDDYVEVLDACERPFIMHRRWHA